MTEALVAYLEALARMDHDAMMAAQAPGVVVIRENGERRVPSAADALRQRNDREFEKRIGTLWTYRVIEEREGRTLVELRESNGFYDLMGVGSRWARNWYAVAGGRIQAIEVEGSGYERGDYSSAVRAFQQWAIHDAECGKLPVIEDGGLSFTAASATPMMQCASRYSGIRR